MGQKKPAARTKRKESLQLNVLRHTYVHALILQFDKNTNKVNAQIKIPSVECLNTLNLCDL